MGNPFDFDVDEKVNKLNQTIEWLQEEVAVEMAKQRAKLRFGIEKGKIVFEKEVLRRHEAMKRPLADEFKHMRPQFVLSAPVIYSGILLFPFVDLWVTIYQHVCFPVYGIEKVKRSDYLVFDRSHLAYLNAFKMLNCGYCSYVNGVIAYAREVAARTEEYWCPIKHAKNLIGYHERYKNFADFGDAKAFVERYMKGKSPERRKQKRKKKK